MPADVALSIAITEVALRVPAEGTLQERTLAAMRAARKRVEWLDGIGPTTEEDRYRWAIGAMLHKTEGDEYTLLERSVRCIRDTVQILNALVSDVPVDLEEALRRRDEQYPDHDSLLPLMEWWRSTT